MIRARAQHSVLFSASLIAILLSWACGGNNTGGQNNTGDGAVTDCADGAVEICDGVDNNCDGVVDEGCSCADGETQDCFTGDPTLEGIGVCESGTQTCDSQGDWGTCEGEILPSAEVCNGEDDDCDNEIDEDLGSETCGDGICTVTVESCQNGQPVTCVPGTPNPTEACDGVDDDCDGTVDEDCDCVDDLTQPCYTGSLTTQNVGECHDGIQLCVSGAWDACVGDATPVAELCNGLDDDCDGVDDNGDPEAGGACDTGLLGVCAAGIEHCIGGAIACVQTTLAGSELCDGLDNDCDPATPDGADDPALGVTCDGTDFDLCSDGVTVCTNGAVICDDDLNSVLDLCDGIDNDCNPLTADGAGESWLGATCDGADTDLCEEGVYSCVAGSQSCSDNTGSTIDICDGFDNDCDPSSADGSEDPQIGAGCDGADSDQCVEGTYSCTGGAMSCSDNTSSTTELCNGIDDDCDGSIDESYNRNDNPACSSGAFYMGSISGDTGSATLTDTWWNEEWNRFGLTEDDNGVKYLSATISLYSPPGTDFDLYVYCNNCTGGLAGSSLVGGTTGHWDTVHVRSNDDWLVDDAFDVIVEVRHFSSTLCAYWDLTVTGNTSVATETCN